jgi:alkylated DNA repair protein alkB family protein 8
MQFRHPDRRSVKERAVYLPPRSLLVLTGEARYLWSHGIVPRKLDLVPAAEGLTVLERRRRVSLTFRKVNPDKTCVCDYPEQCDHRQKLRREVEAGRAGVQPESIPEEIAVELEKNHVFKVSQQHWLHTSDYANAVGRVSLSANFVTIMNPISLFSYTVCLWVKFKAQK